MTKLTKRWNPNKTLSAGMWYTVSNVLTRGLSVISTPIFTRIMTQEDFGSYNNFIAWMSLLMILTTLDLHTSINRAKFDHKEDLNDYIASITFLSTSFTILCYVIVLLNKSFFTNLFNMTYEYITILFVMLIFSPIISYYQTVKRLTQDYKKFVFISILQSIGTIFLSVILVLTLKDKLLGRILGYTLPIIIIGFFLYIYIILNGKKLSLVYFKYALMISTPLIPHSLSNIVLSTSDRIMIQYYLGSEHVALYSLAYNASMIITLLWTSMNQAWSPWLMNNLNTKKLKTIFNKSEYYVNIFTVAAIFTILIGPELIFILGGKTYLAAKYVFPPVIVGSSFQFLYSMYVNILIYEKKTWSISKNTIISSMLNVLLNFILIPQIGYIAAAYTTLVSYFILFLLNAKAVNKIGLNEIYNRNNIIVNFTVLFSFMLLTIFLYKFNNIRYIVIIIYSLFVLFKLIKNKDTIKELFFR